MTRRWIFICSILTLLWPEGRGEVVLGEETDEFDFDGLPGAQHEFKFEVGAGREECFYQMIKQGGKIHVSFEVMRGGDMEISIMLLQLPEYVILETTNKAIHAGFTKEVPRTGSYAICLDNSYSMMHSKLVYIYYVTYVEEEWDKYNKEIEDLHLTVGNFTSCSILLSDKLLETSFQDASNDMSHERIGQEWNEVIPNSRIRGSIQMVQESLQVALRHQAESRMHVLRDWYLITGNNTYIMRWSILQCIIIVGCTCVQVYFVRRLFRTVNVTPSQKPRA